MTEAQLISEHLALKEPDLETICIPGMIEIAYHTPEEGSLFDMAFVMVAWKIDDPVWKVFTHGKKELENVDSDSVWGRIVMRNPETRWDYGREIFIRGDMSAEAANLVKSIMDITAEYGISPEIYEFVVQYSS